MKSLCCNAEIEIDEEKNGDISYFCKECGEECDSIHGINWSEKDGN